MDDATVLSVILFSYIFLDLRVYVLCLTKFLSTVVLTYM